MTDELFPVETVLSPRLAEAWRKLEQQRDEARAALSELVASAYPSHVDNAAMFKAWAQARAVLAAIQTESEVGE